MKVFSDETSLNGEIYASLTIAPPESHIPVLLPPITPHRIGILIGRLPPLSDAAAKATTEALVAAEAPSRSEQTTTMTMTTTRTGRSGTLRSFYSSSSSDDSSFAFDSASAYANADDDDDDAIFVSQRHGACPPLS